VDPAPARVDTGQPVCPDPEVVPPAPSFGHAHPVLNDLEQV
jgi:hypothetical protein